MKGNMPKFALVIVSAVMVAFVVVATLISVADVRAQSMGINGCQDITESGRTFLTAKIVQAAPGDCIVVKAKKVKIDMSSFAIIGFNGTNVGIRVDDNAADGFQLVGPGAISNFDIGILLGSVSKPKIREVVIGPNSQRGVAMVGTLDGVVRENVIYDHPGQGILITDGARGNTVRRNAIVSNSFGVQMLLPGTSDNILEFNNVSGNTNDGIQIFNTAGDGNVIDSNIIVSNGGFDINVEDDPADVDVTDNVCLTENGAPMPGDFCP